MQKQGINKEAVKKALPYGAIKEIALRAETSIFAVSRVVNQGGKNPKILKVIKDYIEEIQQVNERINILVSDDKIAC